MKIKSKVFFIIFSALIVIRGIIIILERACQISLIGTLDIPIYLDLIIAGLVFLSFRFNNMVIKILVYIIIMLIVLKNLTNIGLNIQMKEYCYKSPQKTNTLIIDEGAFLQGENIAVYEKKLILFKKKFPDIYIVTNDGYLPFENGEYKLNWASEGEVDITYYTNLDDKKNKWKSVKVIFH